MAVKQHGGRDTLAEALTDEHKRLADALHNIHDAIRDRIDTDDIARGMESIAQAINNLADAVRERNTHAD